MSRAATVTMLALAWLTTAAATAEASAPRTSAAEHVAAANRAFQAKKYELALDELRIAYRLAPRPEFLLTFAQIYRAAGQLQQALEACDAYLATVPKGPMANSARQMSAMLQAELAARTPSPPTPPATSANEPAPATPPAPATANPTATPNATATPSATTPTASANELVATTPAADTGAARRRRRALGIGLGIGSVVVVGLAVGLGVGLTVGQPRHSTYGTVDYTPVP